MAISKASAQDLYKHFEGIALNSNDAFMSVSNMGKALNGLNSGFGTMVNFSDQQLKDQIALTQKMGIQSDEANSIMRFSLLTKKSADETLKSMIRQNDSVIAHRKVISDVSKINGNWSLNIRTARNCCSGRCTSR